MARADDPSGKALQLIAVGHHVALFRRDTHAVALLNGSAAAWCEAILGDPTGPPRADATPASDGADLLEALKRAGFLDDPPVETTGPPSRASTEPAVAEVATLGVYRLGSGPRVRLAVSEPALGTLLAATLRPLLATAAGEADTAITVAGPAHALGVRRDGVAIAQHLDVPDARRIALQALVMALHPEGRVAAILHASAVVMPEGTVLLAGVSGSGKSTLALAMVAAGCGHFADDFTALDRSGRTALGFPVAASVKHGSWPMLARRWPGLLDCAVHAVGDRTVRYLDARTGATPPVAGAPIARLIFPTFTAGAPLTLLPLSPEEALGQLLASGSEVVGFPRSLSPMAALVNGVSSARLSFGDLDEAMAAVRALATPGSGEVLAS